MVSAHPGKLGYQSLTESSQGDSVLKSGGHITDAKFDSIEKGMRTDIPPDIFAVCNTSGPDQPGNIIL
jgi:hypothetical protein